MKSVLLLRIRLTIVHVAGGPLVIGFASLGPVMMNGFMQELLLKNI